MDFEPGALAKPVAVGMRIGEMAGPVDGEDVLVLARVRLACSRYSRSRHAAPGVCLSPIATPSGLRWARHSAAN